MMSIHRVSVKQPTVDQCSLLIYDMRNTWYYIDVSIV